jgi:hypothetical protein
MPKEPFEIDYSIQSDLKTSLELAISYCETNIPITDSWSRQGLESLLIKFNNLRDSIGNTFVVGHFE